MVEFARPGLVLIDVQHAIDDARWGRRNNPDAESAIAALLRTWRRHHLPVFHIRHDSTERGSPYRPGQPGNDFKPEAAPTDGEVVVAKTTNSAFIGTDLAQRLQDYDCEVVVYAGVITNNSVETTVRMSGNLGFRSFVVADACWTVDTTDLDGRVWPAEDVHALALANMHGEYATVTNAADVLDALAQIQQRP